jgi:hypothetical protein
MTAPQVGDQVRWVSDNETTICSGKVTMVEDDDVHVLVDKRFRKVDPELVNPEGETLLDVSDILDPEGDE